MSIRFLIATALVLAILPAEARQRTRTTLRPTPPASGQCDLTGDWQRTR